MVKSTPSAAPRQARAAPKFVRTTFVTNRLADFCDEKQLTAQTGHATDEWPLIILKELLDNALDACEEAGTAPVITIAVDQSGISIADNGPGMPIATVESLLDYSRRVSSKEAYVAPCRGAQGNALQTLLAMPYVLSNGERGRVDISAHGQRHEIVFTVDQIHQEPTIGCTVHDDQIIKIGTRVVVHWPDLACSNLSDCEADFLQLADAYAWLNPHLTLTVDWFGRKTTTEATNTRWTKWTASKPTSPHWYGLDDLGRLVAGYIAHDQDSGTDRLVRELVKEFRGLHGTAKQKAVLEETGLSRINLSALANGNGLRQDVLAKLLTVMQKHSNSKLVKPAELGIIGEGHVRQRMEEAGCEMETFQYKKVPVVDGDGLPMVIEGAFAWRGDQSEEFRRLIVGVNWSPAIGNPFRTLGDEYGDGLTALLERQKVGYFEPVIFVLHVAHPRVRYTDRGKSALVLE